MEARGYSVWHYERDSVPGADYIDQIRSAVDRCRLMIVVISPLALASQQIDKELLRAFELGKPILPVLRDLSVDEFKAQKPRWAHMFGAAGYARIPLDGVTALVPSLAAGLAVLGIHANGESSSNRHSPATGASVASGPSATRRGPTVATVAKEFGVSELILMSKAREALRLDIRTTSFAFSPEQAATVREAFQPSAGSTNATLPRTVTLDLGTGIRLELVLIPAGRFVMGSPEEEEGHNDDEHQHTVTISRPFYLGVCPVTQEQYARVMGSNPGYFIDADLPVESVSWFDSQFFCQTLFEKFGKPFRLPTEAEWEFACRAGTTTAFSSGPTLTTDQANFDGKFTFAGQRSGVTRWKTTPVRMFSPNPWGLYDMHGNVWEWCSDWYGAYDNALVTDPAGPPHGDIRILRGGSWFHSPADCRSAQRDALDPGRRHSPYGFRVAMNVI